MTASGCSVLDTDSDLDAQLVVQAVADLGVIPTSPSIRGRDGGYSVQFGERSVWVFGDTFLTLETADGTNFPSNTWSWTTDVHGRDGLSEFSERLDAAQAPTRFFPLTDEEHRFNQRHLQSNCQAEPCGARWALWPAVLIHDPTADQVLAFYQKIYAEPGSFNFRGVGYGVALWDAFEHAPTRPVLNLIPGHPMLLFGADDPAFGSTGFLKEDMLYIYGCKREGIDKPCRLARVPRQHILDRSAWTYFHYPDQWTSDVTQASRVFSGNDILSITFNAYLDQYVAIYSRPFGRTVVARTASAPEGPWSAEVELFEAEAPVNDVGWVYDALAHQEYEEDQGRALYISYSRETAPFTSEMRWVRVTVGKP